MKGEHALISIKFAMRIVALLTLPVVPALGLGMATKAGRRMLGVPVQTTATRIRAGRWSRAF